MFNRIRSTAAAISLSAACLSSPALAQTEKEESNRALIAQGFENWRKGTGSPFDLLADDARWTITGNSLAAGTYVSREDFLRDVIRPFNARMAAPLSPTIHRLYAEGDSVIALFDASGQARDGKSYSNTYAWFMEMKDGEIVEAYAFFDARAFDDLWTRILPETGE